MSEAKDQAERATIQQSIATLEAKIAKLNSTENSKSQASAASKPADEAPKELSGESERIGTTNFDENSEFGNRTAYV